jgi:hypothetical protein
MRLMGNFKMIDFLHKSPKRRGTIHYSELARFLDKTEGATRGLQRTNPKKFELLYMGAVCSANNITIGDLRKCLNKEN